MTDTSVRKIHNFASNLLKLRNIGRPRHEARLILSKVLKKNCLSLLINKNIFISQKKLKKFFKMIYFRCHGKPISRIYGVKEFYSRKFLINKFTLDPRPDSEIIIETIKPGDQGVFPEDEDIYYRYRIKSLATNKYLKVDFNKGDFFTSKRNVVNRSSEENAMFWVKVELV